MENDPFIDDEPIKNGDFPWVSYPIWMIYGDSTFVMVISPSATWDFTNKKNGDLSCGCHRR
jgi:hypothetical protein